MVNTELLAQAAERHGIKASDEELVKILQQHPDFQKDGQFDYATYQQVLRDYYRQTPADYEEDLRRRLAAQKMLGMVQSGAVVSDDEVRTRFEKEGNQATHRVRPLPARHVRRQGDGPQRRRTWPPTSRPTRRRSRSTTRTTASMYQQPERIRARQILVKLAPNATPEQKAEAKERAQALRKEIEGGKDFAEVAKASSEDPGTKAERRRPGLGGAQHLGAGAGRRGLRAQGRAR